MLCPREDIRGMKKTPGFAGGAGDNRGIFTMKGSDVAEEGDRMLSLTETDVCIWIVPCLWRDGAG